MSRILAALERFAEQQPQKIAVTGSHVQLSFRQLLGEADRVAADLSGGATLGTLMQNSPAWVVTDLAAIRAGIQHVPLPDFFSDSQLLHTLQDAAVDTIITDQPERISGVPNMLDSTAITIGGQSCVRIRLHPAGPDRPSDPVAKITYTSGTTGRPRGVRLSLQTIEQVADSLTAAAEASDSDRAMALLPLSILLENIGTVYASILSGAEIVVPDPEEYGMEGSSRIDAGGLAAVLRRYRPTTLIVPPGLLKLLVALAGKHALPDSLRFIAVGGAPAGLALLDEAAGIGLPVYQGYGLSEAGSVVTVNTPAANRPGSVGRPLPHLRVEVSESGEILVHGDTYSGYLGEPARATGSVLATGDSGHFDEDGYLYVTGRMHERIITPYGRNISPEWVEAELLACPAIAQAAVFSQNTDRLMAVLVPTAAANNSALERAVAEVNAKLPDYARIGGWLATEQQFDPARGEMTPGGTPRRAVIREHYSAVFEAQAN